MLPALIENTWILLSQGGWIMGVIFILGQVGWTLAVARWWHFHHQSCPLASGDWRSESQAEIVERKLLSDRALRGVFGEVVQGLSATRQSGRPAMVQKTREVMMAARGRLHRHLGTIAVLASSAPLLGLAGTVSGIMSTFRSITTYGVGNPAMLAGGIAQALMVTEAGLVVALPLLILHNHLQNQADRIESDCAAGATALIRVYAGGKPA